VTAAAFHNKTKPGTVKIAVRKSLHDELPVVVVQRLHIFACICRRQQLPDGLIECPHSSPRGFLKPRLLRWQASFVGAMAIADLVKTTLGPKGMVGPSTEAASKIYVSKRPEALIII
jgi:hypothetical protein